MQKLRVALENPHDRNLPPSRLPKVTQKLLMGVFLAALFVSTIFAFTEHWRRASFLLGTALVWLSVIRMVCDSSTMGVLAVRSRKFDSAFTALLGATIVFLATSVDPLGS